MHIDYCDNKDINKYNIYICFYLGDNISKIQYEGTIQDIQNVLLNHHAPDVYVNILY
jgi:hypothetical protein